MISQRIADSSTHGRKTTTASQPLAKTREEDSTEAATTMMVRLATAAPRSLQRLILYSHGTRATVFTIKGGH